MNRGAPRVLDDSDEGIQSRQHFRDEKALLVLETLSVAAKRLKIGELFHIVRKGPYTFSVGNLYSIIQSAISKGLIGREQHTDPRPNRQGGRIRYFVYFLTAKGHRSVMNGNVSFAARRQAVFPINPGPIQIREEFRFLSFLKDRGVSLSDKRDQAIRLSKI